MPTLHHSLGVGCGRPVEGARGGRPPVREHRGLVRIRQADASHVAPLAVLEVEATEVETDVTTDVVTDVTTTDVVETTTETSDEATDETDASDEATDVVETEETEK